MNILISGNDGKVTEFYNYFKDKFPDAQIAVLLETSQKINHQDNHLFNEDYSNIPAIYGSIEKIDFNNKQIYLKNSGIISFDIFISLSILVPSVEIFDDCLNVHYYFSNIHTHPNKIISEKNFQHILLITEEQNDYYIQQLSPLENYHFILKAPQIAKFHYFDDHITSVTTTDHTLYVVDYVLVSSAKYKAPAYLCNSMLTFEQMELYNVFHFNYPDRTKMDLIWNKLKNTDKYFCILNMKLVPECHILEEQNKFSKCCSYDACLLENNSKKSLLTYINQKALNVANYDYFSDPSILDKDISYNDSQSNLHLLISWIRSAREATFWRLFGLADHFNDLKIPDQLQLLGTKAFFPDKNTIKSCLEWILSVNLKILQHKSQQKTIEQRIFTQGLGNAIDKGPFILYFGSRRQHHDAIIKSYKSNECAVNILTMGCGGLSLSMSTAWPHLSGYLEQEYIVNLPECVGIISDQPCLMFNTHKTLNETSIPLIDTSKIPLESYHNDWDTFFSTCAKQAWSKSNFSTTLFTTDILIDSCNEKEFSLHDKWLFIPACTGDWKQSSFIDDVKQFINEDYSIYSLGCSLSVLAKAGYYPEYLPNSIQRKLYGSGSYENIITSTRALSGKTKLVLLSGPIKIDAWIDALILNKYFEFSITSNNDIILNMLGLIDEYFS
jgi:hypothetical protein